MRTKMTGFVTKMATGIAAVGSAVLIGVAPMPVSANTGVEANCVCEDKCTENEKNDDCPVCAKDISLCQGAEKEEPAVTPEPEKEEESEADAPMGPLTPDGNLTLVDDYGDEKSGKQFITFTTKNGNYFYLIIDRDDSGNETVHFLNLVDERDILSLMDEDEVKEYAGKKVKEEPVTEPVVKEEPEVREEPAEPVPAKKSNAGVVALLLVMIGGVAGGYFYYTNKKKQEKAKATPDPDADYDENDDGDDYLDELNAELDIDGTASDEEDR